jgi:putative two-component system response regulator
MKKRILIVDDEPQFTSMLRLTLEAQGYYQVQAENSASAARQAARFFDPDLIILDVMMPELDGSELAATLKEDRLLRDVPILFMTALVDSTECGDHGGQMYLSKNVPVDRLIACIEEKLQHAPATVSG